MTHAPSRLRTPTARRLERRGRRGANAIELALTMPVFILLVTGIFEFSWMFFRRTAMIAAVRSSCRAAAVERPDDAPGVAEGYMIDEMSKYWTECSGDTSFGGSCIVDATLSGTSPREVLDCEVKLTSYTSLTGLVPVPTAGMEVRSITRLELQR